MDTKSEYEPTPRFPLFPSANDQRAKSELASRKGLMADGWWLVIAEWRTETKRYWYPHPHRHPTKQQQQ